MVDPLIIARDIHYCAVLSLLGVVVFDVLIARPEGGAKGNASTSMGSDLRWIAWLSLGLALVSGAAWLLSLSVDIAGEPLGRVLSDGVPLTVLTGTRFGEVWLSRGLLLVPLCLWLGFAFTRPRRNAWLAGSGIALAVAFATTLALVGHAGATLGGDGLLHVVADGLHLFAAGAWIGGLLPLALLLNRAQTKAPTASVTLVRSATLRFTTLGTIAVGTLLVTGTINTLILAGTIPALVGTTYGRLLLLKIALFAMMIAIAASNRLRLTPRLLAAGGDRGSANSAIRLLSGNALIEVFLGLAIITVVAVLGSLPPALHTQTLWPFPVRFSTGVFTDPSLRLAAWVLSGVALLGALIALSALIWRRAAWSLVGVGLTLVCAAAIGFPPAIVPAHPTTFDASPTSYSAQSIAVGADLFKQHCARCHVPSDQGDDPAPTGVHVSPVYLTPDRLSNIGDGDLFWLISNGGGGAMPAFGTSLDPAGVWHLVDYLRANIDSWQLNDDPVVPDRVQVPAPTFAFECPDGSVQTTDALSGKLVHVVFANADSAARLYQLAALDLGADLTTIVVGIDHVPGSSTSFCVAENDPAIGKAFALYVGATDVGGPEVVIDPAGNIRSIWRPGVQPDWGDTDVLSSVIAGIRAHRVVLPPRPQVHVH